MKVFAILLLGFLILTPIVKAESITTSDKSVEVEINNEINTNKKVRQEIKSKAVAKSEEMRSKITAIRREKIRNHFGKIVVRLEATIERLEKLISRLEKRNADVTEAKTTLAKASDELANLKSKLEQMLSSDDPKVVYKEIKDSLNTIKNYLKETHKLLVQTIGDIKGLRVGEDNEK